MKRILWLDLEMTGLHVEKEVIIEAAAIVTDLNFNSLEQYHAIVKQPQKYLDAMDDWNKEHHSASGLIDKIPFGKEPEVVEEELCQLIHRHFKGNSAVLAGNSISQDRNFISKYFPRVKALLHYRMLDVTAFKVIFKNIYGIDYEKKNSHRALDDIVESIEELKHYMWHIHAEKIVDPITGE